MLIAVLAVFLLAIGMRYASFHREKDRRQALRHDFREAVARIASAVVDDEIRHTLESLRSTHVDMPSGLHRTDLTSLVTGHSGWVAAGLIDQKTGQLTTYPPNLPAPLAASLKETSARPELAITTVGSAHGDRAFVVGDKVSRDGRNPAFVFAVVSRELLVNELRSALPGDQYILICDERGAPVLELGKRPDNWTPQVRSSDASSRPDDSGTTIAQVSSTGWRIMVPSINDNSGEALRDWVFPSVIMSIVTAALALTLGKRIASPIRKLSRAAAAVSVGDFRRRVTINTGDELQSLAESFNKMAASLERHESELATKTKVQDSLFSLAGTITSSLDSTEVARSISAALERHFGAEEVVIFRLQEITGKLEPLVIDPGGQELTDRPLLKLAEHALNSPSALSMPARSISGSERGTVIAVPLVVGSQKVGALAARLSPNTKWDPELKNWLELLETFASWAAVAVHNATIHGRTEGFMRMLNSLRLVVEAISSSLDLKHVLNLLVQRTGEVMDAKACAILLLDQTGRLFAAEAYNLSPEFQNDLCINPGEAWSGIAFTEKRPIVRPDLAIETDHRLHAALVREGVRGFMCAPLMVAGEAIGTINVWMDRPYQAHTLDLHLLTSIASHAAAVIANARLFGREYQIAETLQTTLKAEVPERIGRLTFGHKYMPGLDEASVGGDLYDVMTLGNGRVALVVADVVGKGIQAAVHTAMIRYMARAFIFQSPDSPGTAMANLNRAALNFEGTKVLVTVMIATIDPETGWMVYANAGHPPAILLTRNGKQQNLLYRTGMPVGYDPEAGYLDRRVLLKPGDRLLLYTDGVIEAKRGDEFLAIEGLEDIVFRTSGQSPADLVETVCREATVYSNYNLKDDMALVAADFD